MAAPLTKTAVRTTFVSGRFSTIRRFGCHAGTTFAEASLFFAGGGAIFCLVLNHEAHEAEPVEIACRLRELVGDDHLARPQPRDRVCLQRRDAEGGSERALEPGELRGKLDANHLP